MIYTCPICSGQLQAVREEYLVDPILNEKGSVVNAGDSWPSIQGGVYGDAKVCCENGHSHKQILAKIKK